MLYITKSSLHDIFSTLVIVPVSHVYTQLIRLKHTLKKDVFVSANKRNHNFENDIRH